MKVRCTKPAMNFKKRPELFNVMQHREGTGDVNNVAANEYDGQYWSFKVNV